MMICLGCCAEMVLELNAIKPMNKKKRIFFKGFYFLPNLIKMYQGLILLRNIYQQPVGADSNFLYLSEYDT